MAYPLYLRERARELRTTKHLSLNEIAKRLALPKTTVYGWIVDLPLGRPRRENPHKGNLAMLFRARLQAWIDRIRSEWALDSAPPVGA